MVRDRSPQQNGDPLVGSQDRGSLVGWGIGEDELRVQSSGSVQALRIFCLGTRSRRHIRSAVAAMLFVVSVAGVWSDSSFAQADEADMTRRQQGILTGMPFMANITPR